MSEENKKKSDEALERIRAKQNIAKVLSDRLSNATGMNIHPSDLNDEKAFVSLEELINEDIDENTVILPSHNIHDYDKASFKPFQRTNINTSDEKNDAKTLATVEQFVDSMIIPRSRVHNVKNLMKQAEQGAKCGIELPEWGEPVDYSLYTDIVTGKNQDIFVSLIALQDQSKKGEDQSTQLAVLIYNKKEDKVGIVSDFAVSESDNKKFKENGVFMLNFNEVDDVDEFMNFIKAGNTSITEDDICKSALLTINPDLVEDGEDVSFEFISSMIHTLDFEYDIGNKNLVCCVQNKQETLVNNKLLNKMQQQMGD